MASLVQAGLPPLARVTVQDNLRRRPDGRPLVARAGSVSADGVLQVDNLPDSSYGIYFARAEHARFSIPSIDVGDRAAFRRAGRRPIPAPVKLKGVSLIQGRCVFVYWKLPIGGVKAARYVVEAKRSSTAYWFQAGSTNDPDANSVQVDWLPAGVTYSFRVKAFNADGRTLGPSTSLSVALTKDPDIPATLDALPNGITYGRVLKAALDASGMIDLASSGIRNRGALAVLDSVSSAEISKDAVTSTTIRDGSVTSAKIASGAIVATSIATGAVGATQLASSVTSLTKVSGGILTGSGSTATLPSGKVLDASAGAVKLKKFTAMPTASQVVDGEWFAVTTGASMGIYLRSGTVAMNGAGIESSFSS